MSFHWRVPSPFHSRGFRLLTCFAELGASVPEASQGEDGSGLLDPGAKQCITVALAHWRLSERVGDEQRRLAFASLRSAFELASHLDVRLYMYMLSDEACKLYQAYEREVTE